jgi:hypothetical protein
VNCPALRAAWATRRRSASAAASSGPASSASCGLVGVSCAPLRSLTDSTAPSPDSSARICLESTDWAMCSSYAARLKFR